MPSIATDRLREMLNWWKWLCLAREVGTSPGHYPGMADTKQFLTRWRRYERMVLDNTIPHANIADWCEHRDGFPYEEPNSPYW